MATPPKKNQPAKAAPIKKVVAKSSVSKDEGGLLFKSLENFFTKNGTVFFIAASILSVLFSLLLFDVKMSNANDDSMYIESAYKFSKDYHNFHVANAPLYPMFLSIFITLFGLKVVLLKAINVVFILAQIVILFFALRKRVPNFILIATLLIISVNSFFAYFASQTFTEAMFCSLQAILIWIVAILFDRQKENDSLQHTWMHWIAVGFMLFLLSIMKNIAVTATLVLILYFLVNRKFLSAFYSLVSVLIFRIPFEILKSVVWGSQNQYSNQGSIITQKDPYDASKGLETFSGYITRIIENANLYISKRFFQILSFKSPDSTDVNFALVGFFAILVAIAVWQIIKHGNSILLFISIYFTILMGATFAGLQVQWDQTRFILVYVPLVLLVVFSGFFMLLKNKSALGQFFYLVVVIVIFCSCLFSSFKKSIDNYPILKQNLAGDIYFGYSEDWVNYLRMSEYCADSLKADDFVAARKAPMSFIYARGKEFYPVYTVFASDADSVLSILKKEKVSHILLASLRRNPKVNDGNIINTMNRLVQPVVVKYPQKLTLVKQIGDIEPAYLYKINY